jgi:hypothetical protein
VQLVAARQDRIKEEVQNNRSTFTSSVAGACQDITRKDLALWDHSIRAWFRRADKAKEWSEDQLALVRKNIILPVSGGSSTYDDVMNVWKLSSISLLESHRKSPTALYSWRSLPGICIQTWFHSTWSPDNQGHVYRCWHCWRNRIECTRKGGHSMVTSILAVPNSTTKLVQRLFIRGYWSNVSPQMLLPKLCAPCLYCPIPNLDP